MSARAAAPPTRPSTCARAAGTACWPGSGCTSTVTLSRHTIRLSHRCVGEGGRMVACGKGAGTCCSARERGGEPSDAPSLHLPCTSPHPVGEVFLYLQNTPLAKHARCPPIRNDPVQLFHIRFHTFTHTHVHTPHFTPALHSYSSPHFPPHTSRPLPAQHGLHRATTEGGDDGGGGGGGGGGNPWGMRPGAPVGR